MAASIIITGSTNVYTGASLLGSTDADNDINIKIYVPKKKIHTNVSGPEMFEKIINLGCYAIITIPFIKFDESAFAAILKQNASAEGQVGTLGADVSSFDLTITAAASGQSWNFPKAWIEDHHETSKFGYEPQKFVVTFYAQPDPTLLSTATTVLYTNS